MKGARADGSAGGEYEKSCKNRLKEAERGYGKGERGGKEAFKRKN